MGRPRENSHISHILLAVLTAAVRKRAHQKIDPRASLRPPRRFNARTLWKREPQKDGGRGLSTGQQQLLLWICNRLAEAEGTIAIEIASRRLDGELISALSCHEITTKRHLNDATYLLRAAINAWEPVEALGYRVKLACDSTYFGTIGYNTVWVDLLEKVKADGTTERLLQGRPQVAKGVHEFLDRTTVRIIDLAATSDSEEGFLGRCKVLYHLALERLKVLQGLRARRKKALKTASLIVLAIIAGTLAVDQLTGGHMLRRIVKRFTRQTHRPTTAPLLLPGGGSIKGSARPLLEPTREFDLGEASNLKVGYEWQLDCRTLLVAADPGWLRYVRELPDSDDWWIWKVGIQGVTYQYATGTPALRLDGGCGTHVTLEVEWQESYMPTFTLAPNDGSGVRPVIDGVVQEPADEYEDRGVRLTSDGKRGIRIHSPDHRVIGREIWRPPRFSYTCDASLQCSFTLSTGPWHPCWQYVEVRVGDGIILSTLNQRVRSHTPSGDRYSALQVVAGPTERDDWDARMVGVDHWYEKAGVYPFAFGIKKIEAPVLDGTCLASRHGRIPDAFRRFSENVVIAPNISGQLPLPESEPSP